MTVVRHWRELSLALPPRGMEPLLLDALRRGGARQVRRASGPEGDRVWALFLFLGAPPKLGETGAVEATVSSALPGLRLDPRWHAFDGEGWLEARSTTTLPLAGAPPLRILPGVAFGDGEHPTTRRCLAELSDRMAPGARFVDVGAGSGILALAAALLGAGQVLAVEMDPAGCLEMEANARLNGVEDRVVAIQAEVRPGVPGPLAEAPGPWDGIAANLEAGVLVPLFPDLATHLAPGGWLLASGILASERDACVGAAEATGLRIDRTHADDGWWTLVFAGGR
jgi:ribosomal protein L11 methylase PrmA